MVKKVSVVLASENPRAGEAGLRKGRCLTDCQDSDGGGPGARGRRAGAAWALRILCCHHVHLSTDSQSRGRQGSSPTQPCWALKGESLSPPPLSQSDWFWSNNLELCF